MSFRDDVLAGLSRTPKSIPSKHFYDAEGSRLFEAITQLPEYYPTRTETALLQQIAPELAATIPAGATLVEFGSGASVKTRILLSAAPQLAAYAPIDISRTALAGAAASLAADYPALRITPVEGDFTEPASLVGRLGDGPLVGFFPGSTIGNFEPPQAAAFLAGARRLLGPESALIVGVDLVKDEATLLAAYNDAAGVTAAFNKNLLVRMQRELCADIGLDAFAHRAIWNADESRIEMHLVSLRAQTIDLADSRFELAAGETIHTENSGKFTLPAVENVARTGGWDIAQTWRTEPAYALVRLTPREAAGR